MSAPSTPGFAYRPALDGLRAVSVLAVIAYHLGWSWAPGGFLGVDVFFVLSGYLITSLLVQEHGRTGRIDLVAFWGRRARRLLPALLLLLLAVSLWGATVAAPDLLPSLRWDGLATLLYSANWHLIRSGQSYFDLFRAPSPLRHTWSLAIEEQFYLAWPLVTAGILWATRRRRSAIAALSIVGIIVSVAVMARQYDVADPSRAYYGTDSRAHSLLVGAVLAVVLSRSSSGRKRAVPLELVGAAGAVGVGWAMLNVDDRGSAFYHGGSLVFALAVAAVIAASVGEGRSLLRFMLSAPPLCWIGRISYGLYLWHWPVQVILTRTRVGLDGLALDAARIAATFAAAAASFYLVERRVRYGSLSSGRVLALAPPAMLVVGVAVALGTIGGTSASEVFDTNAPITAPESPAATAAGGATAPVVAVVGDSVAGTVTWGLEKVGPHNGLTIIAGAFPGCGIANGFAVDTDGHPFKWSKVCEENIGPAQRSLVERHDPDLVVWLSTWDLSDRMVDGRVVRAGTPAGDRALTASMTVAYRRLTAGGAHIAFLSVAPRSGSEVAPADSDSTGRVAHYNDLVGRFAAAHPRDTTVIDLAGIICARGAPCPDKVDGLRLRPDGGHFTKETSRWVANRLVPLLVDYIEARPSD